jgi:NADP-dependent 3-hydroxy acid dehydrogenase YdfG
MGRGDYMVNNVRLNLSYLALDTDLADAKKAFDVHFWGMVHITQIFMPQWIESKATVTINASLAGTLHVPWGSMFPLQRVTSASPANRS